MSYQQRYVIILLGMLVFYCILVNQVLFKKEFKKKILFIIVIACFVLDIIFNVVLIANANLTFFNFIEMAFFETINGILPILLLMVALILTEFFTPVLELKNNPESELVNAE